jgi:hypothetical protein
MIVKRPTIVYFMPMSSGHKMNFFAKHGRAKHTLASLLAVGGCFLALACVQRVLESGPAPAVPRGVPEAYHSIYREIDAEIDRQLPVISLPWKQKKSATRFGVHLWVADGNRGEALLSESALELTSLALDRLKSLGVQSVSVDLPYPLLTRNYPRAADYREFYRKITAEIRKRGLTLVVELGAASREPGTHSSATGYHGVKREVFGDGLREMAETVIADIRPDFLTLLAEPDTQTQNSGLAFSLADFAAMVRRVAVGLDHANVQLGAGAGSWVSYDYFKALANIPELHYIDLHIFPIQYGFASDRILKAEQTARAKGKRVSIGAAWLHKISGREFNRISPEEVFARNAYSFWQPLDVNFIQLVVNLTYRIDAEFCSFSGTQYLYGYVEHTPETSGLSAGQIMDLSEQTAAENLRKGNLSPSGERLRELLSRALRPALDQAPLN